jgi:5-methylcytosine-specific restriction endonuclease McrA
MSDHYKRQNHLYLSKIATFEEGICVECGAALPDSEDGSPRYTCSRVCSERLHALLWVHIQSRVLTTRDHKCAVCEGRAYKVTHNLPLYAGGTSEDSNLILLCGTCHAVAYRAQKARAAGSKQTKLDAALRKREASE